MTGKVSTLVHIYNCTKSSTTGFSPYLIMYGRHCRLPIDELFGVRLDLDSNSLEGYVQKVHARLQWAYGTGREVIKKEQEKAK